MSELQQMRIQLTEALGRLKHLEDQVGDGKDVPRWQFLVARPHRWRRQLSIKGRNLTVGQLVSTIHANKYTPEQASDELDLPLSAIKEALDYYAENRELIEMETSEERRRISEKGHPLEPKDLSR